MGKIDLLDRKIIYYLDQDSRQSSSAIAKKLNVAKETVNFRINRLLKNKVIKGFYPLINTNAINSTFFKIFIKLKKLSPTRRNQILDFLAKYPRMSQVLLIGGQYDIQLFFLAEKNSDVKELINSLNDLCGDEIEKKEILLIDKMYRFNLKFLYDKGDEKMQVVNSEDKKEKIDKTDLKILKEISHDARTPILDIAEKSNVSPQTAIYHLKKLKSNNVLVSTNLSINYDKINLQHYHIAFQVNDSSALKEIINFFNKKKKSIFATESIGYYDGSTEVVVKNNEELREIIDNLLKKFSERINLLDTFPIYKEYQLRLYPI